MSRRSSFDIRLAEKFYIKDGFSIEEVAGKLNKAPSTVRYHFKKNNVPIRTKSEAQELYLSKNGHQRVGKEHSEESREKISENSAKFWNSNLGKDAKRDIQEKRKEWWDKLSNAEQSALIECMKEGARENIGKGSKFEEEFSDFLELKGLQITRRTNYCVPGKSFEVDIFLEEYSVAIEVDGPMHFQKIYNDDTLEKHTARDEKKAQLLNNYGIHLIRVRNRKTTRSQAKYLRVFEELMEILNKLPKDYKTYIIEADKD